MANRHRRGWVRLALPSVLLFSVTVSATVAVVAAERLPRWAGVVAMVALAVAMFIPIRGRVLLVEWFVVVGRFLRRRHRPLAPATSPARDIAVLSGDAGVRWDGWTLVAAVEVAPNLAITRETDGCASSDSELPLSLVASLMSQYGLSLDIDIVSSGRHVPPGTAYRTVYAQSVGPRPIVGQRRTWLVLRLDALANLDGVVERGPSRTAAPRALAAAAHRVVQRLNQHQIRAYALSADELDALSDWLLRPVAGADGEENWSVIRAGNNFLTTYLGDAGLLADRQLDRWWSWRTEDTVVTIRLTGGTDRNGPQVGVLARYLHHGKALRPLAEAKLKLPTGTQRSLLAAALPVGDDARHAVMPTVDLASVDGVRVPIGPSGQILGQCDDGTLVAVALWDQSGHPRRLRIDARVGMDIARQLVLRAVVTGAVVALHTDDRQRWEGLVATVDDEQRLFYATAGARESDIAVFDGRPVTTVPTRTVLRILNQDGVAGGADMTLVETAGQLLEVRFSGQDDPVTLWVIRTREEDRYLGLGHVETRPRRTVSTEPSISRSARRTGAIRPRDDAPAGQGPQRHFAGPQRTPRSQRPPAAPIPTARRPRRDFGLPPREGGPHPPH